MIRVNGVVIHREWREIQDLPGESTRDAPVRRSLERAGDRIVECRIQSRIDIHAAGNGTRTCISRNLAGTVIFTSILLDEPDSVLATKGQRRSGLRVGNSRSQRWIILGCAGIAAIEHQWRIPIACEIEEDDRSEAGMRGGHKVAEGSSNPACSLGVDGVFPAECGTDLRTRIALSA